jgi:hypothetical protein
MKNVATGMALRFYELLSQEEAEELRRRNAERRLSLRVGQTVMKGSKEAEVPMSYSGRTSSQDDSFTVLLKRFNGQWVVTGYRTMTLGPFGGEITTE